MKLWIVVNLYVICYEIVNRWIYMAYFGGSSFEEAAKNKQIIKKLE
jgi:hypothetical protein